MSRIIIFLLNCMFTKWGRDRRFVDSTARRRSIVGRDEVLLRVKAVDYRFGVWEYRVRSKIRPSISWNCLNGFKISKVRPGVDNYSWTSSKSRSSRPPILGQSVTPTWDLSPLSEYLWYEWRSQCNLSLRNWLDQSRDTHNTITISLVAHN